MHTTRIFRNGNSQAVRIPAEIAYDSSDFDLEIERIGDEIRLRPLRPSLDNVMELFSRFDASVLTEGRGSQEQSERDVL